MRRGLTYCAKLFQACHKISVDLNCIFGDDTGKEYRNAQSARSKANWAKSHKMRAAIAALWADPDFREKLKVAWANPDGRKQRVICPHRGLRAYWDKPENVATASARTTAQNIARSSDIEYQEKHRIACLILGLILSRKQSVLLLLMMRIGLSISQQAFKNGMLILKIKHTALLFLKQFGHLKGVLSTPLK
jgi:hypothetical protein